MRQGRSHRISSRELGLGDMVEGGDGGDVDVVRAGWGVEATGTWEEGGGVRMRGGGMHIESSAPAHADAGHSKSFKF